MIPSWVKWLVLWRGIVELLNCWTLGSYDLACSLISSLKFVPSNLMNTDYSRNSSLDISLESAGAQECYNSEHSVERLTHRKSLTCWLVGAVWVFAWTVELLFVWTILSWEVFATLFPFPHFHYSLYLTLSVLHQNVLYWAGASFPPLLEVLAE